jgi:sec-independent protein translocase protein TatC
MDFFIKYSSPEITAMFSFGSYIGFINSIMLAFGVAFELPIVVVILSRVGLVNSRMLHKASKFVFLAIIVLAAMLTPPDVISQLLLTGPMFLLYELSVLLARIFEGRRKRAEQAEQDEDDDDEAGATADA